MGAPGLVSPDSFPIRDPRSKEMTTGRIANPPRYSEIGGLDSPGKWHKDYKLFAQAEGGNKFRVERPTSVKSAHPSERDSD